MFVIIKVSHKKLLVMKKDEEKCFSLIREAMDTSNELTTGQRIGAVAAGIFFDPIFRLGHILNKLGVETEGLTDEDLTRV